MAKRIFSVAAVGGVAMAAVLFVSTRSHAQVVASDQTAGLVVFPKVTVDVDDIFRQGRNVDTLIQLTNTSSTACRAVHCYYVDATSHCSNGTNSFDPGVGACRTNADCDLGGMCEAGWVPGNINIFLSHNQAVGWKASTGGTIPLDPSCTQAPPGTTQTIQPVREHFFTGELKCFEVDASDIVALTPINANDLKGEATTYEVEPGPVGRVDVRAYNGIGVQTRLSDGSTQNDKVMCLGVTKGSTECAPGGANQPEYASCPAILVLDHWFDGAVVNPPNPAVTVTTDLTLVPCSEDFSSLSPPMVTTTVQFLVYNEFEQRFSVSTRVTCFDEQQLSAIGANGPSSASIFNVGVQGTLTGQTRIRPVLGPETNVGHGLLGVAEEFNRVNGVAVGSAAFNLNYVGSNQTAGNEHGDFIRVGP